MSKIQQQIDELEQQLYIVEGTVTDLLTQETFENLNRNYKTGLEGIAVGSAIVGQIGTAALSSFAASDEGIEVSDFALELTTIEGRKYYFKGCFPEVVFNVGDDIKVIAQSLEKNYARAVAVLDQKKNYIWTSQEVVKGRMQYRIFGMKFIGGIGILGICTFILFTLFGGNFFSFISDPIILVVIFVCLFICLWGGWRIGASFDAQSIELEAILKKLGFYKPSRIDLQHFALTDLSWKNKDNKEEHERWKDYTYRIDLAKKYDEEKYGQK